jgi:hypothetical protein
MNALFFASTSSSDWSPIGVPFANHVWQSTLFSGVAELFTLLLRDNHPRTRYWLWFLASTKFLFPFSLLVGIGSHLGWARASSTASQNSSLPCKISQSFILTHPTTPLRPPWH